MKTTGKVSLALSGASSRQLLAAIQKSRRAQLALLLGFCLALGALAEAAFIWGVFSQGFAFVLFLATILISVFSFALAFAIARKRKSWVHQWAWEQVQADLSDRQNPRSLEEMEALVEIFLSQGKVDQADRISQKMLLMAEQGKDTVEPAEADHGQTISTKKGLPSWMNPGEDKDSMGSPSWLNPP